MNIWKHKKALVIFGIGAAFAAGVLLGAEMNERHYVNNVLPQYEKKQSATAKLLVDTYDLYNLVNDERKEAGLAMLSHDPLLLEAAQLRVNEIVATRNFSHTDSKGTALYLEQLEKIGYEYYVAGENLAECQESEEKTVSAWMESIKHRENMLLKEYTNTAIASAFDGMCNVVVQLFSKPL